MLTLAAGLLGLTTLMGLGLLALYQWVKPAGAIWAPGAVHGIFGLVGYGVLLASGMLARTDPKHFGMAALFCLGGALAAGLILAATRLRRSQSSFLILSLHATLAAAGMVMLAAVLSG